VVIQGAFSSRHLLLKRSVARILTDVNINAGSFPNSESRPLHPQFPFRSLWHGSGRFPKQGTYTGQQNSVESFCACAIG